MPLKLTTHSDRAGHICPLAVEGQAQDLSLDQRCSGHDERPHEGALVVGLLLLRWVLVLDAEIGRALEGGAGCRIFLPRDAVTNSPVTELRESCAEPRPAFGDWEPESRPRWG
jgi:hypothetical protein